jgi:uncharacterized protein (TIGR00251 family)
MDANPDSIEMTARDQGVEFPVKVVPGSSRHQIAGVWNTALRVAVTAPPQRGKANKQLIRLLAGTFGVKPGDVTVTHGQTQPLKRVHVAGVSLEQARHAVATALGITH